MHWKSTGTITILVTFLLGVLAASCQFQYDMGLLVRRHETFILLICLWLIVTAFWWMRGTKIFWVIILPVLFVTGYTRYVQVAWPDLTAGHIGYYVMQKDKKPLPITAQVVSDPETDSSGTRAYLGDISLDGGEHLTGSILFDTKDSYDIRYGDEVSFTALLAQPSSFGSFDYRGYLARYGAYGIVKKASDFRVSSHGQGSSTISLLYTIKRAFATQVLHHFPDDVSGLMMGILLGTKASLSQKLLDDFKTVGVTHIIALSGFNITIITATIDRLFKRSGRKKIFIITVGFILAFVVMTGAAASIVRAGIMGFLFVLAKLIGRKSNISVALGIAATVMVLLNPLILYHDVGFQLSFLATLGLVYMTPVMEHWLVRIPELIREPLATTLAAQVFVLPLLIWYFHSISLISPVANVIILPFVPLIMLIGFTVACLGFVSGALAAFLSFPGTWLLRGMIWVSQSLAQISWASLTIPEMTIGFWILYALMILLLVSKARDIKNKKFTQVTNT
ncbi:MAG: ComEC/Rec2 family competence protein [Patescibacteria group bacterium]